MLEIKIQIAILNVNLFSKCFFQGLVRPQRLRVVKLSKQLLLRLLKLIAKLLRSNLNRLVDPLFNCTLKTMGLVQWQIAKCWYFHFLRWCKFDIFNFHRWYFWSAVCHLLPEFKLNYRYIKRCFNCHSFVALRTLLL